MLDQQLLQLVTQYRAGPAILHRAVAGLTAEQLNSIPIPGTWSIRQVVCHIADSEILYADRIKRILAEDEPPLMKADPASYLNSHAIENRNLDDELNLIEAIRVHITQILRALTSDQFNRQGIHSTDGRMTLRTVVERVTAHIPHHVSFIEAKRRRLVAAVS